MLRWFMGILREELRSMASISFFLVLALTVGAGASWAEHGGASRYTVHAATMASTTPDQ